MRHDLHADVILRLKADYGLEARGAYLRKGRCPECKAKDSLYIHAEEPRVLRCGRLDKCGQTWTVKSLYPDLFENWSSRFKASEAEPTAAADAYLLHARRLNLTKLRGHYTQEQYFDREAGIGSATVRFPLPGGAWWERLIDEPGRFDRKARFAPGKSYMGEWWQPPQLGLTDLAAANELWIVEGIFDAQSLAEHGVAAVSAMSCNNYPEAALARLALACGTKRPLLVWAFDNNKAGREFIAKFHKRAEGSGWRCAAALTAERIERRPKDWNDLHLEDADEHPRFGAAQIEEYRWNGDVMLAPAALDRAKLIALRRGWSTFTVEHGTRLYWAKVDEARVAELTADMAADPMTAKLSAKEKREIAIDDATGVTEIANCLPAPLYFQFDPVKDEGGYYFQIDFPGGQPPVKSLFSAGQVVNAPDFAKRLAAISPAAIYKGGNHHLLRLRDAWTGIRRVESVYVLGYVREHGAYIFPDHAVADGKVVELNREDYFGIGKLAVKPASTEHVLDVAWSPKGYDAAWLGPLYGTFGPRGMVALAFWFGTLFAEQIRDHHESWPFLEIVGEAGTGKSTLIEFLWLLLGRANYEGFDPSKSTAAARARNLGKVGNLPVVLIESDRTSDDPRIHARQFDWDELKTAYNGRSVRSRGVANGGMDVFEPPFRGGIVISQNEPVNASDAVMQRIVSLRFTRAMQSPATRKAVERLLAFDLKAVSGFLIEAVRREGEIVPAFSAAFRLHEAALRELGVTNVNRLIKCHAQLLAALDALALVVPIGDEVRDATADCIRTMLGERHAAISADHPVVVRFWELFDYLSEAEEENVPATFVDHSRDPNVIAVSLVQFEERCAQRRLDLPPSADLKKHLKTSKNPRFVGSKTVNSRAGRTLHCWVFQRAAPAAARTKEG
ncbi:MAG: toprim domain-containing protein [Sphingomonadaceae bacterium]|nr:toprim domain-containing protein [Sphingomonadaceae bacterium]